MRNTEKREKGLRERNFTSIRSYKNICKNRNKN